jgi:ubiquinone/menaquinone biosynthesis C-methylase UbiE
MASSSPPPDVNARKQQQQTVWSSGDFSAIATGMVVVGENLCEAIDLNAGSAVLDVACGSGNTAIAAARRNCDVTGIDIVAALLERAQERATAERLAVRFDLGDAEDLPYREASFDVVLSTFGAMFAPNQERTASEILRVCRPGGTIGMANWTPDSWAGTSARLRARFLPPPPHARPPTRWGTEQGIRDLFGSHVKDLRIVRREFVYRDRSPEHWQAFMSANFGPTVATLAALDSESQQRFADELLREMTEANTAKDGTLRIPSGYLEVVARRV